jgi:myosin heavy subunit
VRRLSLSSNWDNIVHILAGILHLGNIDFVPHSDGSLVSPSSMDASKYAAALLGFEEARLHHAITYHTIKIQMRREETSTPLPPTKAIDSRNGAHVRVVLAMSRR